MKNVPPTLQFLSTKVLPIYTNKNFNTLYIPIQMNDHLLDQKSINRMNNKLNCMCLILSKTFHEKLFSFCVMNESAPDFSTFAICE